MIKEHALWARPGDWSHASQHQPHRAIGPTRARQRNNRKVPRAALHHPVESLTP